MADKETIIALIYDFDKTLCTKDMQEYTFIPQLGLDSNKFWHDVHQLGLDNNMDKILAYLYYMCKLSREKGHEIRREDFKKCGEDVELFNGVESWFPRINAYGEKNGVKIEHYIISSGNKEIIENTKISKYFKEIFASEFLYEDGYAVWPSMAVNYTTKTQYLVRINKGVLNVLDDYNLNKKMMEEDRRISNCNMIYIGDGITDIPCMTMTREKGGHSIAVYNKDNSIARGLLEDNRVNFIAFADYSEGSEIDTLVKGIIDKIVVNSKLDYEHKKQIKKYDINK